MKHHEICMKHEAIRCELPTEDNKFIKFKNHGNTFAHPTSVFLDFESTLETVKEIDNDKTTVKYQKHIVNSVGYKFNCIHDEHSDLFKF